MIGDRSTSPDLASWHVMKAGRLTLALQCSKDPSCSPYGLLLWAPEEFVRKESTWLYHPELGLGGTMLFIDHLGTRFGPDHKSTTVSWIDSLSPQSGLLVEWHAGDLIVQERFIGFESAGLSGLRREILVTGPEASPPEPTILMCGLYPNPLLFKGLPRSTGNNDLAVYRQGEGVHDIDPGIGGPAFRMRLVSPSVPAGFTFERFVQVEGNPGTGAGLRATLEYVVDAFQNDAPAIPETESRQIPAGHPEDFATSISTQVARSLQGISAVVDRHGRFDAAIWQYGYEWGQDAAIVATALAYCGWNDLAWRVTTNILDRLTDDDGRIAESSRFRGGEVAELNANGAVLSAVATCAVLSGDDRPAKARLNAVNRIGDLVVEAIESSPDGLITGRRDLWERLPWMGVREGADIATNSFVLRGLRDITPLLRRENDNERADRWAMAASRMSRAMFTESSSGFIEAGRLIHRRLSDGSVSRSMIPDNEWTEPGYRPYIPPTGGDSTARPSDPDSVAALPFILDLVTTNGELARRTLDHLHTELWNQTGIGGYLRSPLLSDPDSPGPWPFVTAWMAEAELRAGLGERAHETTDWLLRTAGAAGTWHEYYGPRQSPPFPPVGIIVWGWAQFLLLAVRGWYGIRLGEDRLHVSPQIDQFRHTMEVSGHILEVVVNDRYGTPVVEGSPSVVTQDGLEIPLPLLRNTRVTYQ